MAAVKKKSKAGRPRKDDPRYRKKVKKTAEMKRAEEIAKRLQAAAEQANTELAVNLTGGQIQEVLDALIIESVRPIILNSPIFDLQIVYVLATITRNKKRKLSTLSPDEARQIMCSFLSEKDLERKVVLLSGMKLERGFIYNFIVKFLGEVKHYSLMHAQWLSSRDQQLDLKLRAIESSYGFTRDTLAWTIQTSTSFLEETYSFRNIVVMNYLKHAFKQARSFVAMKGKNFDVQDVFQNFLAAVTKGVDKYDSSKGALTSYINFWVLNAQTVSNSLHGHEYNIAYTIPQLHRKALATKNNKAGLAVNFSVSLEGSIDSEGESSPLGAYLKGAESVEHEIVREEETTTLRKLAKAADSKGMARLYLDIEQTFNQEELSLMLKTMEQQLGLVPTVVKGKYVSYTTANVNHSASTTPKKEHKSESRRCKA